MSNVLSDDKRQQIIALGRLEWSLRRIEEATGVRRETASAYLKAAGIPLRPPRAQRVPKSGQPAGPSLDLDANPASLEPPSPDLDANPASLEPPSPDPSAQASPAASSCEPYREIIEQALARGRNGKAIWQDLVDDHGFTGQYQSVKRFVKKLRAEPRLEARPTIETAPG